MQQAGWGGWGAGLPTPLSYQVPQPQAKQQLHGAAESAMLAASGVLHCTSAFIVIVRVRFGIELWSVTQFGHMSLTQSWTLQHLVLIQSIAVHHYYMCNT